MSGVDKLNNSTEIMNLLGISFEQYNYLMGLTGIFLSVLLNLFVFMILANLKAVSYTHLTLPTT